MSINLDAAEQSRLVSAVTKRYFVVLALGIFKVFWQWEEIKRKILFIADDFIEPCWRIYNVIW